MCALSLLCCSGRPQHFYLETFAAAAPILIQAVLDVGVTIALDVAPAATIDGVTAGGVTVAWLLAAASATVCAAATCRDGQQQVMAAAHGLSWELPPGGRGSRLAS